MPFVPAEISRRPPQCWHSPFKYLVRFIRFLALKLQIRRNQSLDGQAHYVNNIVMSSEKKYLQENSARIEDAFVTRRQFLQRAGMGSGALSLAALLGDSLFSDSASAIEQVASLSPREPQFPANAKH